MTSATFMLVMGFKQAVTSHLEEGIFFPNDVNFFFDVNGHVMVLLGSVIVF